MNTRKVFVESLPKWEDGSSCVGKIKWKESVGKKVHFIYDDIEGDIQITKYDPETKKLTIKYRENELSIFYGSLLKGQIGKFFRNKAKKKENREIYLESLPTYGTKGLIDWRHSIGCKVKFNYCGLVGVIEIIDYNPKKSKLTIKYGAVTDEIYYGHFVECKLGKILGKRTKDYKYEINEIIKDENRNLVIIDRKIISREPDNSKTKAIDKYYRFKCNNCGYESGPYYDRNSRKLYSEHWVLERNLMHGSGCGCCSVPAQYVVPGINDINTLAPWMAKYFRDNDAEKYTHNSNACVEVVCPLCGQFKRMKIQDIYDIHSIGCVCGDGAKYPEKFIFSVLDQLDVAFVWQFSQTNATWCKLYKYDFFFEYEGEGIIVEVHGKQHYEEKRRGRTLEEEQENDKQKLELAMKNGILKCNYVVIDCRESQLDFIKSNILASRLAQIFDLSRIDWMLADEYACSNLVKKVCDLKRNNPDLLLKEIANMTKLTVGTVSRYLVRGTELGWCDFVPRINKRKFPDKRITEPYKVEVFKDGKSLGVYESAKYIEENSIQLFGIKMSAGCIRATCAGKTKTHVGYIFKYVE